MKPASKPAQVKLREQIRVTHITQDRPMENYEVHCGWCGEDFEVSLYPDYCVVCGRGLSQ